MALIDSISYTDPVTGFVHTDYKLDLGMSGQWVTRKQFNSLHASSYDKNDIYNARKVKVKGKKRSQILIDYDAPNLTSFDADKDRLFFPEESLDELGFRLDPIRGGVILESGNTNIVCIIPTEYSIFDSKLLSIIGTY